MSEDQVQVPKEKESAPGLQPTEVISSDGRSSVQLAVEPVQTTDRIVQARTRTIVAPEETGQIYQEVSVKTVVVGIELDSETVIESLMAGSEEIVRANDEESWKDAIARQIYIVSPGEFVLLVVENRAKDPRKIEVAIVLREDVAKPGEATEEVKSPVRPLSPLQQEVMDSVAAASSRAQSNVQNRINLTSSPRRPQLGPAEPAELMLPPETRIAVVIGRRQAEILLQSLETGNLVLFYDSPPIAARLTHAAGMCRVPNMEDPEQATTNQEIVFVTTKGLVETMAEGLRSGFAARGLSDEERVEIVQILRDALDAPIVEPVAVVAPVKEVPRDLRGEAIERKSPTAAAIEMRKI